ncbi:hypothetical protein HD554DRAFT_2150025 [Boletus coccyginus]|nr:hypothetical protein HD554DRAFT_2150025 [Boletus coccyginus]
MIAAVLTFLLFRKRTDTEFSSTAHILQRITVLVVNAGLWTATFALLSLIFLHLYPVKFLNEVFSFSLCSIYCNTTLANLNARAYIRGETRAYNTDVDLFASSTLEMFDTTGCDKHRGGPRVVTLGELSPPAGSGVR